MPTATVLLVENRPILRSAIASLLRGKGFKISREAGDLVEAARVYASNPPDVILICGPSDGAGALEVPAEASNNLPRSKMVKWFSGSDEDGVSKAIQLGMRGILCEKDSVDHLSAALEIVARGGAYYSNAPEKLPDILAVGAKREAHKLAPREMRVLRMVADGKTSKEIAVILDLEIETIRNYRKSMMRKLNVHNIAGLLKVARAGGLLQASRPAGSES